MSAVVDHIGVVVRGIDEALPYLVDELGMHVVSREELPAVGVRVAYLDAGSTLLQLVEPLGPGPLRDHLEREGEGLHHLCLAVPDIDVAVARLAPGAEVNVVMGGRGRRACFLPTRASGLRIELTEVEPATG